MKIKTQLKKLDARGFSHDIGIVVFAVIFAIVGVGYLVASHADSCPPVSRPTSEIVSHAASEPSCPTSVPVSSTASGNCTVGAVPVNSTRGQQISPTVTYTNTGSQSFSTISDGEIRITGDKLSTPTGSNASIKPVNINPGQSITIDTGLRYTADYRSNNAQRVSFTVSNSSPAFSCSASTNLPAAPPPITPPPVPAPVKLAGTCSIKGIVARPAYKQVIKPYVIVSNTGTGSFQPKIVERLQVGNSNSTTSSTLAILSPGGSTQKTLKQYVAQRHSGKTTQATYSVTSTQPKFSCTASLKLP